MNIENLHKRDAKLHTENVSEVAEKQDKLEKRGKRIEKRSKDKKNNDVTANYMRKEGDRLIKQIHDQCEVEIKKVTTQLAKDLSDTTLTDTEITSLQTQADTDRQEIKHQYEQTVNETNMQLKYQSHAAIGYMYVTGAKANLKRENQESLEKAKKTVNETAAKLHKKSAELEQIENKVHKSVEKLQKSLEDLKEARGPDEVSLARISNPQTTIVLNQYYKALTHAHDMMNEKKAKEIIPKALKNKSAEKILEKELEPRTGALWKDFSAAQNIIDDKNAGTDQRAAAVKALLRQVLKQHTTFRLDPMGDTQVLSPEAQVEKRLNEVLTQDDVHRTMQQARQVLDTNPHKFQKSLKKAVIETINYARQSDAQEKAIHQEAAKQFILQVRASSEIRHDVWQDATASLKQGRKDTIASIKNADAEMQHALDLVQHFSPEAAKKVQTFRKDFQDRRSSPQQFDHATALYEIQQNFKESSAALPKLHEDIQRYINIDTQIDPQEIPHIAKSAINELMQLGKKQANDTLNIDSSEYEYLNKQINERYTKAIKKAQDSDDKKDAETQRNASLAELARLYPKAKIGKKLKKVQEDAQQLQEMLAKKTQTIVSLKETLAEGERAYATQRRYETNNQGEYLVLENRMLQQGEKMQSAQSNLTAILTKETHYQNELHKAEDERSDAKDEFEKICREIDRKKMNDGSLKETHDSNPMVEAAKERYANAREEVRKARHKCEEVAIEKLVATSTKEQEQQKYNTLEIQRDMAKKRYDSDEDKIKRYIEGSKDLMKATLAFERQQSIMRDFCRYQIKAAIISGFSQMLAQSLQQGGTSQYAAINRMLISNQ